MDSVNVISIDIGLRNLAVVIKQIDRADLLEAGRECVPSDLRYDAATNELLPSYKAYLDKLYGTGSIVHFNKISFTDKNEVKKSTDITDSLLRAITAYICAIPHIGDLSSVVLIERQITRNVIAVRVQDHIHSTLINLDSPRVFLVWSWLKTRSLGAPAHMNEGKRKRWAYETASHIVHAKYPDTHVAMYRTYARDRADLSDAFLQMHAWLGSGGIKMIFNDVCN